MKLSIFPVTERGFFLASGFKKKFAGSVVFSPGELKGGGLKKEAARAFGQGRALVFISATGIAVRTIAPLLRSKDVDPPVVVMDEQGRFAISLVSGHLGGANELAGKLANVTGAVPVITTATDLAGLPCVEDIAKMFGLSIENTRAIKRVNSAILAGEPVLVVDNDLKRLKAIKKEFGKSRVFEFSGKLPPKCSGAAVHITSAAQKPSLPGTLIMRPREIIAGIGCGRGVTEKAVRTAVLSAFNKAGLSPLSLKGIASIDIKKDERGLLRFAESAGVEIRFYRASMLNGIRPPSGGSKRVFEETGALAVAEPAALLHSKGKLCLKKTVTRRVTVALAREAYTS